MPEDNTNTPTSVTPTSPADLSEWQKKALAAAAEKPVIVEAPIKEDEAAVKAKAEADAGKAAAVAAAEREKNSAHLQDVVKANADKEAATRAAEEAAYTKAQMKVPGTAPQPQMAAPAPVVPMTEATKREMAAGKAANDAWSARRQAEINLGKQLTGKPAGSRK